MKNYRSLSHGRRGRRGMALLLVLSIILIMTLVVVEMSYTTRIQSEIAINERDEVKAYYLARAGYDFAKAIIVMDAGVGDKMQQAADQMGSLTGGGGLTVHVWDLIPISYPPAITQMLTGGGDGEEEAAKAGGDGSDAKSEAEKAAEASGEDEYYNVEIEQENCKLNLNLLYEDGPVRPDKQNPAYLLLVNLLTLEEYVDLMKENYNLRQDLPYALMDYIDADATGRNPRLGSDESAPYSALGDNRYKPKDAPYDSLEEIFLVEGMTPALYARIFSKFTTVYGGMGGTGSNKSQISMNCDLDTYAPLYKAMLSQSVTMNKDELFRMIKDKLKQTNTNSLGSVDKYLDWVQQFSGVPAKTAVVPDVKALFESGTGQGGSKGVKTQQGPQIFTVRSTGTVGGVNRTITAVVEMGGAGNNNQGGQNGPGVKLLSWRTR